MILSLGPASAGASASLSAPAWVLGLPSVLALAGYGTAALMSARFGSALRTASVIGWLAHAVAIFVDIAGIGSAVVAAPGGFAPALSMTIWLVLAVYVVESRFVPLPRVRRTLAALGI